MFLVETYWIIKQLLQILLTYFRKLIEEHNLRAWHNTSATQQAHNIIRDFVHDLNVVILAIYFNKT